MTKRVPAAMLLWVGGAILVIGAILPWGKVGVEGLGSLSVTGIDGGDGKITIVLAVLLALLGWLVNAERHLPKWIFTGGIAFAAIALATGLTNYVNLDDAVINGTTFKATVGIGLWITITGGAIALVGSIMAFRAGRAWYPVKVPPSQMPPGDLASGDDAEA